MTNPEYAQWAAMQQLTQPPAPQQQYAPPAPPQQFGPPQGYPQFQPGYGAPQGYGQQPPAAPLATGSLDDYFSQPSTGGGPAVKFEQIGVTRVGVVSRPITNADIQQQTQPGTGQPAFYKDGRPKFVMKVPLQVPQSNEYPEGQAQLYVAGGMRDELVRAMAEAGAPEGPPETGAGLQITCTGTRPSGPGMNPAKVYRIVYTRPNGSAPVQQAPQAPAPAQQAPQAPAPAQQAPAPQQMQHPAPQYAPQQVQAPVAATPPVQPQAPAPSAVPPVNIAPTEGLDDAQRALLEQLTSQQK